VQRLPNLLNEVHRFIEAKRLRFVLNIARAVVSESVPNPRVCDRCSSRSANGRARVRCSCARACAPRSVSSVPSCACNCAAPVLLDTHSAASPARSRAANTGPPATCTVPGQNGAPTHWPFRALIQHSLAPGACPADDVAGPAQPAPAAHTILLDTLHAQTHTAPSLYHRATPPLPGPQ
jgi:hypothetical protein